MQRSALLPLRRLAQAPKSSKPIASRTFATASQTSQRIYHCISPLSRRPEQFSSRRNGTQLQTVRGVVYTNKDKKLRDVIWELQKGNPFLFPFALVLILAGVGCGVYLVYFYITVIYPVEANYPGPIANKLKRALHYTYQDLNPQKALDYYSQALRLCEEHEMNPFSEHVLGIRMQISQLLILANNIPQAVELTEKLKSECLEFVDYCDMKDEAELRPHRTRVLAKAFRLCVTLGHFYENNPYTRDDQLAEKSFEEGLQLMLTETHRREKEKLTDEEWGPWVNYEEIGAALEAVADFYEKKSKHYLAAPLYLRAITMAQPPSCHTAILMNNLAASLVQTTTDRPPASSDSRGDPPTSRPALIANARQWAEKSLQICQSLAPENRTDECDQACAVATHNLGEFAEMEGLVEEARKWYTEARGLAKATSSWEGVQQANQALKRLSSSE